MKVLYFDCFSGISGDMILGALLDVGLDIGILRDELSKLKLGGYEIKRRRLRREGIIGTRFEVNIVTPAKTSKRKTPLHHSLKEILTLIEESKLDEDVKELSRKIFQNLAKSESKMHGIKSESIFFDELGDIDSIIDIVGASIGIKKLGIEEAYSSGLKLGTGYLKCRAGRLPVPAPATLELLKDRTVSFSSIPYELTTPTGAAVIRTICKDSIEAPSIRISAIGYGVGRRRLKAIPNLLRVVIGDSTGLYKTDTITVLETAIDDMSPINYGPLFERLFREGVVDVYITPIQMKKSRPGALLTILLESRLLDKIVPILFDETPTFGVRYYQVNRWKLGRELLEVKTKYGKVKVKIGKAQGVVKTISPEYEDCRQIAQKKNIPFRMVYEEAKKAYKDL